MTEFIELSDSETDELMAQLRTAFAGVDNIAPVPGTRRPAAIWAVAAVIVLCLVIAGGLAAALVGGTTTATWAAEPHSLSAASVAAAVKECRGTLGRGTGLDHFAYDARGTSVLIVLSGVPTKAFLDSGDTTSKWGVWGCLTVRADNGLPKPIFFRGSMASDINTNYGFFDPTVSKTTSFWAAYGKVVPGVVRVEMRAKGLPRVEASVRNGRYAMWWPTSGRLPGDHPGVIVELNAAGKVVSVADKYVD